MKTDSTTGGETRNVYMGDPCNYNYEGVLISLQRTCPELKVLSSPPLLLTIVHTGIEMEVMKGCLWLDRGPDLKLSKGHMVALPVL